MSDVVIRPAMPADLPNLRLAMVELQEHERRLDATTRLPGEQIADATSSNYLRFAKRHLIDRIDVNRGAVDQGKVTILFLESKKQIRAAKNDGISTLQSAQILPNREEYAPLRIVDTTCDRHLEVGLVHQFERFAFG